MGEVGGLAPPFSLANQDIEEVEQYTAQDRELYPVGFRSPFFPRRPQSRANFESSAEPVSYSLYLTR